jgi:hypothetical protein
MLSIEITRAIARGGVLTPRVWSARGLALLALWCFCGGKAASKTFNNPVRHFAASLSVALSAVLKRAFFNARFKILRSG